MRVAGLDLSLTSTGYAEVHAEPLDIFVERVRSAGKKSDGLVERGARLRRIRGGVLDLLDPDSDCRFPDLVVIENPSYGSKFGSPHDRSGFWWSIVDVLLRCEVPIATVAPQGRALYGTGKGNADKATVFAAVQEQYPAIEFACDDQADAMILAAMGCRWLGHPIDPWLDGTRNVTALDGASWPS